MLGNPTGRDVALEIIQQWEGCVLEPYLSQEDGGWTIGWGHKLSPAERQQYAGGITQAEADALLLADMAAAEVAVAKIQSPLNANQYGALVSLCFNIGAGAFASSSACRLANAGEHDKVPAAIKLWDKVTVNGKKVVSKGLKRRREHEAFVYARPVAPVPAPLSRSRTMAGSITSATATGGSGAIELAQDVLNETQTHLTSLSLYLDVAKYLLIAVALIGLGLVIYARLSDRDKGHR